MKGRCFLIAAGPENTFLQGQVMKRQCPERTCARCMPNDACVLSAFVEKALESYHGAYKNVTT
jgi:hypothetical protein